MTFSNIYTLTVSKNNSDKLFYHRSVLDGKRTARSFHVPRRPWFHDHVGFPEDGWLAGPPLALKVSPPVELQQTAHSFK